MATVTAPLFRDPIYDGAADPTIIFNRQERSWWIVYTSRRANVDCRHWAWGHGTDIGAASLDEEGAIWNYRGTLQGLEIEPGRNTFWAPEILWHEGLYHMYVSYVQGVPHTWAGSRRILHYTSENLWNWTFQSKLELSSDRVIDACVGRLPSGIWRMWYKDEANNQHTYAADSTNLYDWQVHGPVITDCEHEGPNVFRWKGYYWMITDPWDGLGVYRSDDADYWERQGNILKTPGIRSDDEEKGHHADVLVAGEKAYILYHVHPGGHPDEADCIVPEVIPYSYRRSSIQMAELLLVNGVLTCDRDADIELSLGEQANRRESEVL